MVKTESNIKSTGSDGKPTMLVHMCCGPCSIMPLKDMVGGGVSITGYYYNPNVHPEDEYIRRLEGAKTLAEYMDLPILVAPGYDARGFIDGLKDYTDTKGCDSPPHGKRCTYCYSDRLMATALAAREGGFDLFSTSLLYSKYQKHMDLRDLGIQIGSEVGVEFFYEDYRDTWQDGIDESKEMGLYRQQYCGCIYSRMERYGYDMKGEV